MIGPEWTEALKDEFTKPYLAKLMNFVTEEYKHTKIWPEPHNVFAAYRIKPADVKVVIIGQDPYPNKNAHGLSFSSNETRRPVSLHYIFKEIADDLCMKDQGEAVTEKEFYAECFPTNNLTKWANQGVMLLNAVLTVRENDSNSHIDKGWEEFTTATLTSLLESNNPVVVVSWGKYAQNMTQKAMSACKQIHGKGFFQAGHPAAAAYGKNVFNGCRHFSKINDFLLSNNLTPIEWSLR
jgi:uracil-DNA glycosylase